MMWPRRALVDAKRGYLRKTYFDCDHDDVTRPSQRHGHVLAYYCVQAVTGRQGLPRTAYL